MLFSLLRQSPKNQTNRPKSDVDLMKVFDKEKERDGGEKKNERKGEKGWSRERGGLELGREKAPKSMHVSHVSAFAVYVNGLGWMERAGVRVRGEC